MSSHVQLSEERVCRNYLSVAKRSTLDPTCNLTEGPREPSFGVHLHLPDALFPHQNHLLHQFRTLHEGTDSAAVLVGDDRYPHRGLCTPGNFNNSQNIALDHRRPTLDVVADGQAGIARRPEFHRGAVCRHFADPRERDRLLLACC